MLKPNIDAHALSKECELFTCYLINQNPNEYIKEKYCEAHAYLNICGNRESYLFDNYLADVSRKSIFRVQIVDAYSRILFRKSIVRKKLILLMAILESCHPSHLYFDHPDFSYRAISYLKIFQEGFSFILLLFAALVILGPIHLLYAFYQTYINMLNNP